MKSSGYDHSWFRPLSVFVILSALFFGLSAQDDQGRQVESMPGILAERDRPDVINKMLVDRLDHLLPGLMRETGIDLWLVINREYAEDPVYLTLVPEPVFAARRTTMLVFFDRGKDNGGIERLTVSRYALGGIYEAAWDGGSDEDQWQRLAEVIRERNPKKIAVNTSAHWAFGDGLSSGLHKKLMSALSAEQKKRVVSAEDLAIRWLETRTAAEIEAYPQIVSIARRVLAEAFSNKVITPGVTTTEDVYWYIRQRFEDLNLRPWFQPYVNIQRQGVPDEFESDFYGNPSDVIRRGDVLHTDVGICYLRLCTDTQEMGYVLRVGEKDVPKGLQAALATGNRWQDILTGNFKTGRTGNEILKATRTQAEAEKIVCTVYTHPLGFYGHAAGPTIGMWDNQDETPIRGDWKLNPNTAYAIEGNVKAKVPEWDDQWVQIKMEQDGLFDGKTVWYLGGRQTKWHVIH